MPIIAAILVVIIGLGGSVAAESSLPGDVLYPVKIGVNENVRAGFTLTTRGKARWNMRRAERRLEEVEALIAGDILTQEKAGDNHVNFRTHVEAAKKEIAALRASGDISASAEVSTELEALLRAHASVLSRVAIRSGDTRDALKILLSALENESGISGRLADDAARMNIAGSASGSGMRLATEASMKSAENKIAEVRVFIGAKAGSATSESVAEANARLKVAQSTLDSARALLKAGAFSDAFASVRKALHTAQEAKLLLEWNSSEKRNTSSSSSTKNSSASSARSDSDDSDSDDSDSEDTEDDDDSISSEAQARINAAAKKIDEVRANLAARGSDLSVTARMQAAARLDAAATSLAQARVRFAASLYAEARDGADMSFRMAIDAQTQIEKDTNTEN